MRLKRLFVLQEALISYDLLLACHQPDKESRGGIFAGMGAFFT
jgi:hypothetical protein